MSQFKVFQFGDPALTTAINNFFKKHEIIRWVYIPESADWYPRIAVEYEVKDL